MPLGSGYVHLSNVSDKLDRLGVGAGLRNLRIIGWMFLSLRNLSSPQEGLGPRVTFAASGSEFSFVRESQDDVEDHHDSIGDASMIETFHRSIIYVCVHFHASCPLSDPATPPLFVF